jgi:hypothetical protein
VVMGVFVAMVWYIVDGGWGGRMERCEERRMSSSDCMKKRGVGVPLLAVFVRAENQRHRFPQRQSVSSCAVQKDIRGESTKKWVHGVWGNALRIPQIEYIPYFSYLSFFTLPPRYGFQSPAPKVQTNPNPNHHVHLDLQSNPSSTSTTFASAL